MNKSSGTWVKNMYMKLEDMCLDIDDFVCKVVDPVQHVVQLIPSTCSSLVGTSTKSVVDIKENTVDSNASKPKAAPVVPKEISSTGSIFLDTDNMIKGELLMNLEDKKTILNRTVNELECDSNTSTSRQSSELDSAITCNENKEENDKHVTGGGLSSGNLHESSSSSVGNLSIEPDTIDCNPTETVAFFSDVVSSFGSFTTVACDSNNEACVSCSGDGLADVDFEAVENDTTERGVIAEGAQLPAFPNTSRYKSYKKMIQDAFLSRKRLTKEYKQLGIWYGDIDKELFHIQPTEEKKLTGQDLPDSEWELL